MKIRALAATAILLALSAPASAQDVADQAFVDEAAASGMFEVRSSELALEMAQDENVQSFARQMVQDHTAANERLKAVAQEEGLTVPGELPDTQASKRAELQDTGEAVDSTYLEMQVEAHEDAISLFRQCAEGCESEALRGFASETLPTLEQHHEHATSLAGTSTN
ncbi:DUF4142 domain-containing protein [Lutibaculum baratangense]|uniref:DUF4142 domain-containing protein n=1 Tax=Lutibaculum baratangense AMV1 TaxID=631454 RepID=V4THK8_9HYPH|nr:DUF4142 domain-containing protein [Lutibaculum baratangense]ESR25513.1 hypothetical protein N177_1625 [Lutibaculum baratangense AMV1]